MSDNVTILPVITALDIPAERILNAALGAKITHVVVLGWDEDGEFYFNSSYGGSPEVIYLCELAKQKLINYQIERDER